MRNLFPPIIKQIDERCKRMAKQKDGRYRAKLTLPTAKGRGSVKTRAINAAMQREEN